jgi:hypothetical protein
MKRKTLIPSVALGCLLCGALAVAGPPQSSYEMTMYHVVLIKHGPNWKPQSDSEGFDVRLRALDNIRQAAADGLVATAGLVNDETDVEFIIIINCETKAEALAIVNGSPNVKNGFFAPEIYSWFAPKGLTVAPPRSMKGGKPTGAGG